MNQGFSTVDGLPFTRTDAIFSVATDNQSNDDSIVEWELVFNPAHVAMSTSSGQSQRFDPEVFASPSSGTIVVGQQDSVTAEIGVWFNGAGSYTLDNVYHPFLLNLTHRAIINDVNCVVATESILFQVGIQS